MTDLEKKVFREVFVGKYVKIPTEEERNKIINFYSGFDIHISITAKYKQDVGEMAYIQTEDGLTAYGLFGMLSTTYNFDDLKEEYEKELRRKKMKNELREKFLKEFEGVGVRVDNKEQQTKVYEIFNKYGFGWVSGSDDTNVDFSNYYKYIKVSHYLGEGIVKTNACEVIIGINEFIRRVKEFEVKMHWQPYTLKPKKGSNYFHFELDADVMRAEIMRGFEATSKLYKRHILGVREENKLKSNWSDIEAIYFDEYNPLPNKIAFRNDTTTLVYDAFKVVRAKASNKDEAIRETGLLIALLKALNVKDYNTIIANAWDTENELTRHFYLYGVVQQLYVDKELLSRNQFNKLFGAVGDKKPNVNIGGKIIEVEYK